jgi:hypothetical protein
MQQQVSAATLPTTDDYEDTGRELQHAFGAIEKIDRQVREYLGGDELQENEPPRSTSHEDVGRLYAFVDDVESTHTCMKRVLAQLRLRLVALNIERAAFEHRHALER